MTTERFIHCVGLSEEDIAHLRLLLRVTRSQLRETWAWSSEAKADLILVNPRKLVGDSARRRAQQREVASAQAINAEDQKPPGLFLRRPFKREALLMLLNGVGRGNAAEPEVESWGDESVELDLGFVDLSLLEADHPGVYDPRARGGPKKPATVVEEAFAVDSLPEPSPPRVPREVDAEISIGSATEVPAAGTSTPAVGETRNRVAVHIDANAKYPLIDYLEKNLLVAPARLTLPGVPSLLFDPVEKVYLAEGSLSALEPYVRQPIRHGDWQLLSNAERESMRRSSFTRPIVTLIWMNSFVSSNGFLSKKFDPSGTFVLTNRFNLAQDYPRAFRVGAQLNVPRRLHEIARLSSVDLDEVCNVINAYEAVGYVEGTRRGT